MNSIWIRHGECTDNVGIPSTSIGLTELTEKGRLQAEAFAASLPDEPALLVHSSFVRSIQTAAPILRRFPSLPVEVWDIHEITILGHRHYENASYIERTPAALAYWQRAVPDLAEGPGAETFIEFMARVESAVDRLRRLALDRPALVTSHGLFMRGVLWRSQNENAPLDAAAMASFSASFTQVHIPPVMPWGLDFAGTGNAYTFAELRPTDKDVLPTGSEA